jgi:Derlin-2/3
MLPPRPACTPLLLLPCLTPFPANFAAAGSFRGRSADFLWMLLFGGTLLTALAPFVAIEFLGSSLTFMMVYVWGRRHQYVNLSFLGIFNFTAPYLPWVLLAFSVMLGSSPKVDLLGMVAGEH